MDKLVSVPNEHNSPDALPPATGAHSDPPEGKLRTSQASRRPFLKRVIQLLRRGHLYFGLFLFPWAVLYGVTAFLFNHPTAFSDQPTVSFGRDSLLGTPLERIPSTDELAEQVVAHLNKFHQPEIPYRLSGSAKYSGRQFAFATVKTESHTVSILVDVKHGGGTIRSAPVVVKKEPEKAPFAFSGASMSKGGRGSPEKSETGSSPTRGNKNAESATLKLADPLQDRIKSAVPTILEKHGFPTGEVSVTSVPDLVFPIEADGRTWTASYNSLTGVVNGRLANQGPDTEISLRRFLLRLHTAHGYPNETNSRWFWAIIVDAMAFTMCFWGVTGLIMWWQIKATRVAGFLILILSAICATALGLAMHAAMTS